MNPDHQSREEEIKNREGVLREQEIKRRMRELEAELDQPTSVQPAAATGLGRPWYGRLPAVAKFGLIAVGVVIVAKLATWLASVLLIVGVGWAGYKLFLERDRKP